MTPGVPTELSREELFAGWRIFVERLAAEAPVVLMLEDAQHADRAVIVVPSPEVATERAKRRP